MDKDKALDLVRKCVFNQLSISEAEDLVLEYCLEKGKDITLSRQFILFMSQMGQLPMLLYTVTEYYMKKFNICKVEQFKGTDSIIISVF